VTLNFDPGSFKDAEGRVFEYDGRIFRSLAPAAASRMQRLFDHGHIPQLIEAGLIVPSWLAPKDLPLFPEYLPPGSVMEHARVRAFTYAYEWPFEMLRDAALLTLELIERCLAAGLILKDATPYNVAYFEGRLVFIDVLSIDDYVEGQPWDAYGQFCREFLFPMMLTAYKGVDFQAWLRGSFNGIPARDIWRIFGLREVFRKGVLKHAYLQSAFEKSFGGSDDQVRGKFSQSVFSKDMILANVRSLRQLIKGLPYEHGKTEWSDYENDHSYNDADQQAKLAFVTEALAATKPDQMVDIGCNTGHYSMAAAETASQVIAADIDPACINTLYRRLAKAGTTNITPVVANLLNPSPALGWNLAERRPLLDRLKSDGFLALALVHHICITGNVPITEFVALLAELGRGGVVEWVDKKDQMVERMLRNREDVFDDYTWNHFRVALEAHFTLERIQDSHEGARKLVMVVRKDASAA
jgi:SAM-dependent methyltransferase